MVRSPTPASSGSRSIGVCSTSWASITTETAASRTATLDLLRPHFDTGKPVVVTEFGMRSYVGADTSGTLGFGVVLFG